MPVYASQSTIEEVRSGSSGLQEATRVALKEKAPRTYVPPNRVLVKGQRLMLAGVILEVYELEPAESESATLFYVADSGDLFTGDAVSNRVIVLHRAAHAVMASTAGADFAAVGTSPDCVSRA